MRVPEVLGQWEEGLRRLSVLEGSDRIAAEHVTDEIVLELRRRLGGPFMVRELCELFASQGTDWAFALATRTEPSSPAAWDVPTVAGAAFARYVREASDYRDLARGDGD
jgi:hypothetical protein